MHKFLKGSGVAIGGFLVGALLVVSIQQVGANLLLNNYTLQNTTLNTNLNNGSNFGPSASPPSGDVTPTVTSLTILDSLDIGNGSISLGGKENKINFPLETPAIKGAQKAAASSLTELKVSADTYFNQSPTQIYDYDSSNFGRNSNSLTSIAGDIVSQGKMGSYKSYSKNVNLRSTSQYQTRGVIVSCPSNTQLVSCSGYINDQRNNFIFQGTFMYPIDGHQSCTSKALSNRTSHIGGDTVMFVSALCFDPRSNTDTTFTNI